MLNDIKVTAKIVNSFTSKREGEQVYLIWFLLTSHCFRVRSPFWTQSGIATTILCNFVPRLNPKATRWLSGKGKWRWRLIRSWT